MIKDKNRKIICEKWKLFPILCFCFLFLSCANSSFVTNSLRKVADNVGVKSNTALEKHTLSGITAIYNEQYDPHHSDAVCDIYFPEQSGDMLQTYPLIVWIHGGGWVAGNKSQMANYCRILAASGYVVVAVNYSLAPNEKYPTPVVQANTAIAYLLSQTERLPIDTARILIGGDSAGAQLTAQLGNVICLPSYAALLGITPSLSPNQLKGLILFCGPYDLNRIKLRGIPGGLVKNILIAYSGTKDFMTDSVFATASIYDYVTENYPPVFISVGNGDPLQEHSYAFARKLQSLGVETDTLFFEKSHRPKLPHEYQFNLDTEDGKTALNRTVEFIQLHAK